MDGKGGFISRAMVRLMKMREQNWCHPEAGEARRRISQALCRFRDR